MANEIFTFEEQDIDLKDSSKIKIKCFLNDDIILKINVYNYGEGVDLKQFNKEVRFYKPDGKVYSETRNIQINNNQIIVTCDRQLTTASDTVVGFIRLWDNYNKQKASYPIEVVVQDNNGTREISQSVLSETEYFDNKINTALQIETHFDNNINVAKNEEVKLTDKISESVTSKNNLDKSNITANNTKSILDQSNANALKTKNDLDVLNNTSITTKGNLDKTNNTALTTNNTLNTTNTNAINTNNTLNTTIKSANDNRNALDTSKTNAINTKKDLDGSIENAKNKKSDLDSSINLSLTKKNELDGSINNANKAKQILDSGNSQAITNKKNLDESNVQASKNLDALNALGNATDLAKDVEIVKKQVLENTYTKLETDSTLTKLESCKDSFVHNMQLRGRTLQNVIQPIKNITFKKIDSARALNIDLIKLNADYSFILDLGNVIGGTNTIHLQATYSDGTIEYPTFSGVVNNIANNITVKKVSFKKELSSLKLAINVANADDVSVTVNSLMVIEGEPKEIPPYFEGIKSTGELEGNKISILTKGKNWIDIDKFIVDDDSRNCIREINSLIMTSKVPTKWQSVGITLNLKLNTEYSIIGNSEVINKSAYPCIRIGVEYPNGSFTSLAISTTKLETTFKTPQNLNGGRIKLLLYTCFDGKLCDENSIIKYSNLQITEGKDFTYEEYKEDKTEILTGNEPLRGLPSGVEDIVDYDKNELTRNVKLFELDGTLNTVDNIALVSEQERDNTLYFNIDFKSLNGEGTAIISNLFPNISLWNNDVEGIHGNDGVTFSIRILKSRLETKDKTGFIKWLGENKPIIVHKLATPVVEKLNIKDTLQTFKDGYIQLNNAITPSTYLEYSTNIMSIVSRMVENQDKVIDRLAVLESTILTLVSNNIVNK